MAMLKQCFIITGTSRGIGHDLAKLLLSGGSYVHGISRKIPEDLAGLAGYRHWEMDLSLTAQLEQQLDVMFQQLDYSNLENLFLINNAAMLHPLKPIEQCTEEEISANMRISLIAPMILTSRFIHHTKDLMLAKKIMNISSGSARQSAPSMSIYSSAKAGLEIFTECSALEQKDRRFPVEIFHADPGMVDTDMQQAARQLSGDEFVMSGFFRQAYANGQLQSTDSAARRLANLLL